MTIGETSFKVEGEDEFKFTIHAVSDPNKIQYDLVFSGCPYGCVMNTPIPEELCTEKTKSIFNIFFYFLYFNIINIIILHFFFCFKISNDYMEKNILIVFFI